MKPKFIMTFMSQENRVTTVFNKAMVHLSSKKREKMSPSVPFPPSPHYLPSPKRGGVCQRYESTEIELVISTVREKRIFKKTFTLKHILKQLVCVYVNITAQPHQAYQPRNRLQWITKALIQTSSEIVQQLNVIN